jgi:hypothetical protein
VEVRQGLLRRRAAGTDLGLAWWERFLAGRSAASLLCFQTVALELLRARPARAVPDAEDLARAYDPAAGVLLTFGDLAVNLARQDGRVLGPADVEPLVARARELGAAQTVVGGPDPVARERACGEALRLRLEAELASPARACRPRRAPCAPEEPHEHRRMNIDDRLALAALRGIVSEFDGNAAGAAGLLERLLAGDAPKPPEAPQARRAKRPPAAPTPKAKAKRPKAPPAAEPNEAQGLVRQLVARQGTAQAVAEAYGFSATLLGRWLGGAVQASPASLERLRAAAKSPTPAERKAEDRVARRPRPAEPGPAAGAEVAPAPGPFPRVAASSNGTAARAGA